MAQGPRKSGSSKKRAHPARKKPAAKRKATAKKTVAKKTTGRRSTTSSKKPAARKSAGTRTNTTTRKANADAPGGKPTTPKKAVSKKKTAAKKAVSGRARPSAASGRARAAAKKKTAVRKTATKPKSTTKKKAVKRRLGRKRLTPLTAFDIFMRRVAIFGVVASAFMIAVFIHRLPSTEGFMTIASTPSMTLIDVNGKIVTTRGLSRGATVDVSDLPPYVPEAVIAIEDRRFYSHFGVDPIGLARAIWVNLKAGRIVQGGSTITQQLAKNLFLTPERTLRRKFQEMALAIWLEVKFSKAEILTLYLNRVYMGAGTYGIEAASQRYLQTGARADPAGSRSSCRSLKGSLALCADEFHGTSQSAIRSGAGSNGRCRAPYR